MLTVRSSALFVISLLALAACERSGPAKAPTTPAENPAPAEEQAPAEASAAFVNPRLGCQRVEAGGARRPSRFPLGRHARHGLGAFKAGIRSLALRRRPPDDHRRGPGLSRRHPQPERNAFRIRMHSPGAPVEILFKPAERVAPEAGQDTKTAVVAPASPSSAGISIWTVVAYCTTRASVRSAEMRHESATGTRCG